VSFIIYRSEIDNQKSLSLENESFSTENTPMSVSVSVLYMQECCSNVDWCPLNWQFLLFKQNYAGALPKREKGMFVIKLCKR